MQKKSIKFELQHLRAAETGHKMKMFHFSSEKIHEKPTYFILAEKPEAAKNRKM